MEDGTIRFIPGIHNVSTTECFPPNMRAVKALQIALREALDGRLRNVALASQYKDGSTAYHLEVEPHAVISPLIGEMEIVKARLISQTYEVDKDL